MKIVQCSRPKSTSFADSLDYHQIELIGMPTGNQFTESVVEEAALVWLESLGYAVLHGPEIAAGILGAERSDPNYRDVVLEGRLRQALARLNLDLPADALED